MFKGSQKIFMSAAALVVLLLLILWMAGLFDDKLQPALKTPGMPDSANSLAIQEMSRRVIEPVSASVEAKQATLISSRIMARITEVNVRAGDRVTQGQALITLDKRDLEAKVQQSREQIRAVEARLKEARQSLERARLLHKQGLLAIADLQRAEANFAALTADLAAAGQALQESETALSFALIRSPIDGVIVDRFAEPGDTASPGGKLLAVYNPLSLRVESHVRESVALTLASGQALQVEIPSLQKRLTGMVEEIVPAAEAGSRSFLVKVSIPFEADLLPGMYARLLVAVGESKGIFVPADRVVQVGQLDVIWVLENNQVQRRFVRVGDVMDDGLIPVLSGLKAGDTLLEPHLTN
jgi:RND family efflux transporter MFP subunit